MRALPKLTAADTSEKVLKLIHSPNQTLSSSLYCANLFRDYWDMDTINEHERVYIMAVDRDKVVVGIKL